MPTPYQIAEQYAAALIAADIRAVMDPRDVAPPCVLFQPAPVDMDTMCGGTARMTAVLIAPPPAQGAAWRALEDLLAQVLASRIIDPYQITPGVLEQGNTDIQVPIYQLEWQAAVDWPQPEEEMEGTP